MSTSGGASGPPLQPPTTPTREDGLFAALWRAVPKPKARDARKTRGSQRPCGDLSMRESSTLRDPARAQSLIRRLGRAIEAILKGYRRRRAEEAGKEVERFLGSDPPLHREAWHWMKGWYRAAVDRAPPPARVTFERITADRVDL